MASTLGISSAEATGRNITAGGNGRVVGGMSVPSGSHHY